MEYLVVEFGKITRESWDLIQNMAEAQGATGVIENDLNEEEIDQLFGEKAMTSSFESNLMIDELESSDSIFNAKVIFDKSSDHSNAFIEYVKNELMLPFNLRNLADCDWNNDWKKHYSKIEIPNFLTIVPEWEKIEGQIHPREIYIKPGQGFGTGTHETTRMCIELLLDVKEPTTGKINFLDFGCGSGILGIAAKKRYQEALIDFMDIDENALDNCLYNLNLNYQSVDWSKVILRNDFYPIKKYEIVFANILLNTLTEEKSTINNCLAAGGYLIVSGLLADQMDVLIEEYSVCNLSLIKKRVLGDWGAILFKKVGDEGNF